MSEFIYRSTFKIMSCKQELFFMQNFTFQFLMSKKTTPCVQLNINPVNINLKFE